MYLRFLGAGSAFVDMTSRRGEESGGMFEREQENLLKPKAARDKGFQRLMLTLAEIIFVRCESDAGRNEN
jgi:hypothetical protein